MFALDNDNLLDVANTDKVTILQYNDYRKGEYGFSGGYGADAKRACSYTDYSYGETSNTYYWTKDASPDNLSMLLCFINFGNGAMGTTAYKKDTYAIRPTIKIQIS